MLVNGRHLRRALRLDLISQPLRQVETRINLRRAAQTTQFHCRAHNHEHSAQILVLRGAAGVIDLQCMMPSRTRHARLHLRLARAPRGIPPAAPAPAEQTRAPACEAAVRKCCAPVRLGRAHRGDAVGLIEAQRRFSASERREQCVELRLSLFVPVA